MKTAIEYYFMCNYVGCVADKVNNLIRLANIFNIYRLTLWMEEKKDLGVILNHLSP